jgi:hypothetical protein
MKKEDITVLAQLLTGMKDAVSRLEKAQKKKNMSEMMAIKREIMNFQKQIDKLL